MSDTTARERVVRTKNQGVPHTGQSGQRRATPAASVAHRAPSRCPHCGEALQVPAAVTATVAQAVEIAARLALDTREPLTSARLASLMVIPSRRARDVTRKAARLGLLHRVRQSGYARGFSWAWGYWPTRQAAAYLSSPTLARALIEWTSAAS